MFFLFSRIAFASEFSDALSQARASFLANDDTSMALHLTAAKEKATLLTEIAKPNELALLYYFSGLAADRRGVSALDFWRKTFSLNIAYEGEADLFASKEQADTFYAIRMEMEYAKLKSAYVPAKMGLAKVFVDGQEKFADDKVVEGEHLLQIQCPKGEIVSRWDTLDVDPNWLGMCPYEIDVNEKAADDPFSLDMLDEDIDVPLAENVEDTSKQEPKEEIKEEPKEEIKEEPKEETPPKEKSYFSGLAVQQVQAKKEFWVTASGGGGLTTIDVMGNGNISLLYRQEMWEGDVQLGTDMALGLNLRFSDNTALGAYFGVFVSGNAFIEAKYRYDFTISDDLSAFLRIRSGYLFSEDYYAGVEVGAMLAVF